MYRLRLGDYVKIRTGKLDANKSCENGKYPFFTCAIEPLKIDNYAYDLECILVAGNGDLNVKYYNGKFNAYQRTYIIESLNQEVLLVKYLFHFMEFYISTLRHESIGGVIKYIKLNNLTDAKIPIPSIMEQNQIIQRLELVATLINIKKRKIVLLDSLIRSRFIEMFGHSDRPKVRLGECCIINPKKSSDIRLVDNDLMVSFVSMSDVSEDGQIVTCNHKQYESVKSGFTYFSENDVLFAKITPCMENGKGGIAKGLLNGIGFGSTEFHVLRPIDQVSNSCWLYELTSFPQFRQAAEINMTGSAGQRRVPASFLANYKVSLPPISLQNQFADFVHHLDKSKYQEVSVTGWRGILICCNI